MGYWNDTPMGIEDDNPIDYFFDEPQTDDEEEDDEDENEDED